MAQEREVTNKENWIDTLRGKPMFIGLCGPIGAGKTTIAKYLVEEHDFERIPFAKILKDMARAFGLTERMINGDLKETQTHWGWTPRQFMQWLGTEFGRNKLGQDIWVNRWKENANLFKRVVADDVRFDNEVDAIHELGGKVIMVDRSITWSGDHASEQWSTLKRDGTLVNLGSISELHDAIDGLLFAHAAGD